MRENLKIVFADNRIDNNVVELLKELATNVEVLSIEDKEANPELVIFTGGEDVTPEFYGQNTGKFTSFNKKRDDLEHKSFIRFKDVPKLGICRGSQFLTVMNNGKLVQHVSGHSGNHAMQTNNDEVFMVTSTHHQMMYPFDLKSEEYELLGWSQYFKSDTYLDGSNIEMVKPRDFLEPEIVYYKNTNSLAIQGHPEYDYAEKVFKDHTIKLIKEKLFKEITLSKYHKWLDYTADEPAIRTGFNPTSTIQFKPRRTGSVQSGITQQMVESIKSIHEMSFYRTTKLGDPVVEKVTPRATKPSSDEPSTPWE